MADNEQRYVSLRPAGTSEKRCIMRHALGYYRGLVVAGRYTAPEGFPLGAKESFYPALKHCISTHPMLSAAIKGELTEAPELIRPETINLRNHVEITQPVTIPAPADDENDTHAELEAIKPLLCHAHDQQFPDVSRIPPWKIVVIPITTTTNNTTANSAPTHGPTPPTFWLLFSYSHSHGDGPSGLSFHRTFLSALRHPSTTAAPSTATTSLSPADPTYRTQPTPALLPPIEQTTTLPVTWPFLLLPVASSYLPSALRQSSLFTSKHLFFRASVTPHRPDAWTALPTSYPDPSDPTRLATGVAVAVAAPATVRGMLKRCRRHGGVKLTGALHGVIVRALSAALPPNANASSPSSSSFVAQTSIDLRRLMPRFGAELAGERNWDGAVGLCVSAAYHVFARDEGDVEAVGGDGGEDVFWHRARETTRCLAERASTLVDQPIGLLRYLKGFRAWLEGQVGREREGSYEVSNLMAFEPDGQGEEGGEGEKRGGGWEVGRMLFSQPANVTGPAVNFNIVTRKGGDMVITLTWQKGVLGVEGDEDVWAKGVCEGLERGMRALAGVQ
ncbi:alcohol acetyltransferase [Diplodia corticola]|uniref:Alcohol acetyltransferase n=1 Tax=Diplodia corticola TaxID=236234 RepID=A0A1J9QXW2_9PEZI|nr:alcohol acetyltransferase [Diplodia corticola]OJD33870.1 alcohol acetyltransferase [Diplodia corticola]